MPSTEAKSSRYRAYREHPDFPWLHPDHPETIERFLRERGFLDPGQVIRSCTPAGSGAMNLTLRINTSAGSLILKQARPWVEKYDHIAAPWDRDAAERRFYEYANAKTSLQALVPKLIGSDPASHVLLLEDVPGAMDLTSLYHDKSERLHDREVEQLATFLAELHNGPRAGEDPEYANAAMRELNYAHLFEVPLQENNGVDLDGHEQGLARAARKFRSDDSVRRALRATGRAYMKHGPALLHGDFYPGSWLRSPDGIRVIDFEFSFPGEPSIDVGCAVAHLALAQQELAQAQHFIGCYHERATAGRLDPFSVARYAGMEVARRLIGVAQLPLAHATPGTADQALRQDLLFRARDALLEGRIEPLFANSR